jgi:hypothetical protein
LIKIRKVSIQPVPCFRPMLRNHASNQAKKKYQVHISTMPPDPYLVTLFGGFKQALKHFSINTQLPAIDDERP